MLGITGITLSLILFIFLAFKGVNLIISSMAVTLIMCVFNFPLSDIGSLMAGSYILGTTITEASDPVGYMTYLAGFIKNYGLLFILSSLLGQLMTASGAARRIALTAAAFVNKVRPSHRKLTAILIIPLLYSILSFIGISGFVVVFAVMPIAKVLFDRTGTPWIFYCFGGPQVVGVTMLSASLQAGNIYAADICGTPLTAGTGLSLAAYVAWVTTTICLILYLLKKHEKQQASQLKGGYDTPPSAPAQDEISDTLPSLGLSLLPLVCVVILTSAMKMQVVLSLFLACLLSAFLSAHYLNNKIKKLLSTAVSGGISALFTVAATYAMGSVMRICPGFDYITLALDKLPGLAGGSLLMAFMAFSMASSSGSIAAFGSNVLERLAMAGLSAETSHRLMTISCFPCMAPHNAGIINAVSVTGIPYKQCLKIYMAASLIPGVAAFLTAIIYIALTM